MKFEKRSIKPRISTRQVDDYKGGFKNGKKSSLSTQDLIKVFIFPRHFKPKVKFFANVFSPFFTSFTLISILVHSWYLGQ